MKYEIKGIKKEETIKNYRIVDDTVIVIYFLDGSSKVVPYTLKNEKIIVDKMLQQANYRESELYQAYMNGRIDKEADILSAGVIGTGIMSFYTFFDQRYVIGLIAILGTMLISKNYCEKIDNEVNDIKKYRIYLEIKDKLEKTLSDDAYAGLKDLPSDLNINTIDDFSLKDLNDIYKKLYASKRKYVGKFLEPKTKIR